MTLTKIFMSIPHVSPQQNFNVDSNVPVNNFLLTGTVLVNNSLLTATLFYSLFSEITLSWMCLKVLAGHASGCWHSALGSGIPYNRNKMKVPVNKELLTGTVLVKKKFLIGTVPVNKKLLTGTVQVNNIFPKQIFYQNRTKIDLTKFK